MTPTYSRDHARSRIRLFNGLDCSVESFDLAAPIRYYLTLRHFHEVSRATSPQGHFTLNRNMTTNGTSTSYAAIKSEIDESNLRTRTR